EAGKLNLDAAARVAGCTQDIKDQIAGNIQAGNDPNDVIASYCPKQRRKHYFTPSVQSHFLKKLEDALFYVLEHLDDLGKLSAHTSKKMTEAKIVIDKVLDEYGQPGGPASAEEDATGEQELEGSAEELAAELASLDGE